MTFRVVISPEAEADIRAAFEWYESRSFGLGGEFLRALKVAEATLARNPKIFQIIYKDVRRSLIRRFPYALHFVIEDESVTVLACFHHRRDPVAWSDG